MMDVRVCRPGLFSVTKLEVTIMVQIMYSWNLVIWKEATTRTHYMNVAQCVLCLSGRLCCIRGQRTLLLFCTYAKSLSLTIGTPLLASRWRGGSRGQTCLHAGQKVEDWKERRGRWWRRGSGGWLREGRRRRGG